MPNLNLYIIGVLLIACLTLGVSTWGTHQKLLTTQAEYDAYVAKAEKLAADQRAKIAQLEKDYADKIHAAELARDAALVRLRHDQDIARANRMSVTPPAPEGDNRVCFARTAFDAALQQFLAEIEGLVAEGDRAMIDNQTLLKAWPQ